MRITSRLAASAVAAGMVAVMIVAAGPSARAATRASGPAGVRAHYAELANEATGAALWSRAPLTERPMGSITKVMTAYLVIPLLGRFPGATGIKTGFTAVAGDCLLFAAERHGRQLIGVVLDSSSSPAGLAAAASDAAAILGWGFGR
jgi:D-alanyl-D-alanine carboxypeptidase